MLESAKLIDTEYLSEISGGDLEFEKELIQAFIDAAPDLITSCIDAVQANDLPKVVYASHTLKGSSRSIGALQFALVAEAVEKAAREGDIESCRQTAPDIELYFKKFVEVGEQFLAAA
jgi:HPt (histidine-containing phosphotransfer) domain-containing protein